MKQTFSIFCALIFSLTATYAVNPIKVNQVGYYPEAEKTAVLEADAACKTVKLTDQKGKTVWKGKISRQAVSPWSGKKRQIVDFTTITQPGTYTLCAGKYRQTVIIREHALSEVAAAGMKAFYLQRTGMPIEAQYAGVYARPSAHPDTVVYVHESAASATRPAGTVISSPYGWYDAGDYNKYIVNSGFTVGLLLLAYEMNPDYFQAQSLNIPESGNGVPDMLSETMYNLRWMLTMQDPEDGGVYHKLTTPSFEGFVRPTDCHQQRYVVQKSTQAALDFAASLAQAARIYRRFPQYADFAEEALEKAEKAYAWAVKHPAVNYDQDGFNLTCKPQVYTGKYDDTTATDEFFWAACELYLATGENGYLEQCKQFMPTYFSLPTWGDVSGLGVYEWILQSLVSNSLVAQQMAEMLKPRMLAVADASLEKVQESCFQSPHGNNATDFIWGSNAEMCAGQGIAMLYAYRATGEKKYLTGALEDADYLLGRNATGYCFVTGFGTQPSMHPHQRLSASDGIEAPLPGFLTGGPNAGQQDKSASLHYQSDYPDESYMDETPSYASNEIAINWNAYLVALMSGLDADIQ